MYTVVVIFLVILLVIAIFSPFRRKRKGNSDWERKRALWFQELVAKFQERFPDQHFQMDESDPLTIVVPPKHPTVGGLRICDGGDNIMVEIEIGPFNHEHFDGGGLWDSRYREDIRKGIVLDVLLFLGEVFEDKVELYAEGGGYRETTYFWSGPKRER